jgi:hypothetical protein
MKKKKRTTSVFVAVGKPAIKYNFHLLIMNCRYQSRDGQHLNKDNHLAV